MNGIAQHVIGLGLGLGLGMRERTDLRDDAERPGLLDLSKR